MTVPRILSNLSILLVYEKKYYGQKAYLRPSNYQACIRRHSLVLVWFPALQHVVSPRYMLAIALAYIAD
jgi:hypothetical protein